jgi:hypothetical protein
VCLDISRTRILDDNDVDVTPPDRADLWLLVVTFIGTEKNLLISDSEPSSAQTC